ncbi:MAG TPA: hypothetical protein PK586_06755 [Casimicrobium sp.]|nr:hypothetical protein [Casimicrobium sp.]
MYVKRELIATLLSAALLCGGGAALAATAPNSESFKVLCDGTNKLPPIYVAYSSNGAFERLNIVRDEKTGQLRGGYVPVAQEHIDGICAKGQAISAAPKPLSAEGERAKVYASYTLPSSFTIATYYGIILGNFWVPGNMPSGHEAHLAQFDVVANYFSSATGGSHFVNSMLTYANWSANEHTGMGMIFGPGIAGSGTAQGVTCLPRSAVTETWHSYGGYLGNKVWNATNAISHPWDPNTCSPNFFQTSVKYTILNGANVLQQSTYWLYDYGYTTPFFQAPIVSGPLPNFQSGYAGITFLVAGYPASSEYWTLAFTNVSQWTQ